MIVVCLVILVAVLAGPRVLKAPKADSNGCTSDMPGRTVILMDHSEDVSKQTNDEILARVRRAVEEKIAVGELVSVFYVSELSKRNLAPVFSYCKPKSLANPLTESEKLVAKIYREKFIRPLEAAITAEIPGSKESPIAQALVDLSLIDQLRNDKPARILIFSDLMEYTNKFSLYKCSSAKSAIAAYRSSRGANVARPTFRNLSVELHVVPRGVVSKMSGECRDGFWAWFFGDNDGALASLERHELPGGGQ